MHYYDSLDRGSFFQCYLKYKHLCNCKLNHYCLYSQLKQIQGQWLNNKSNFIYVTYSAEQNKIKSQCDAISSTVAKNEADSKIKHIS